MGQLLKWHIASRSLRCGYFDSVTLCFKDDINNAYMVKPNFPLLPLLSNENKDLTALFALFVTCFYCTL